MRKVGLELRTAKKSSKKDFPELRKIFATMSSDEFNKSQNYGAI